MKYTSYVLRYDSDVFWYHLKKKPKVRNSTIYNKTYLDKSLTTLHLKKSNSCISVVVNTLIMLQ